MMVTQTSVPSVSSVPRILFFSRQPLQARRGTVLCSASAERNARGVFKSITIAVGAATSVLVPAQVDAVPLHFTHNAQPVMELGGPPQISPKPSDPLEQRKQLAETVGSKSGVSGKANIEGNATLDNPNDSPRPEDRSQMGQPFSSASSSFSNTLKAAGGQSEDELVPFADKSNPRLR